MGTNEKSRKFMTARDVVVDEINMLKSKLVHEEVPKVQLKSVDDSFNNDNVESDFPMVENDESVDSRINVQHSENSTCLKNADPVIETGDEINDNKSEQEIRRSERNKDKP